MLIDILKMILLVAFGLGAGLLTSAGLFAIITSVGLINRFAKVTNTTTYIKWYEEMIMIGVTLGNVAWLFEWTLPLGTVTAGIAAICSGIFIGVFSVCLAETIKALPIFIRRVRIGNSLGIIVLALALGKGIGNLIYQFILYR